MTYTHIALDEHVLIAGMTGSGKSHFAEIYLRGYDYVIKLDSKDEYTKRKKDGLSPWDGLREGKDFQLVEHLEDLEHATTPKIIYRPVIDEQEPDFYDEFFKFCYLRENTIIWIDELMSVATGAVVPRWLKACATQGRSRNV